MIHRTIYLIHFDDFLIFVHMQLTDFNIFQPHLLIMGKSDSSVSHLGGATHFQAQPSNDIIFIYSTLSHTHR